MQESDTDVRIKSFWARKERLVDVEFLQWMEERFREFQDATADHPVGAAEFLSHLDLSFLEGFLGQLYRRRPTYPPEAMLKALFLMDLSRKWFYTQVIRDLQSRPQEAIMLGFPVEDGGVLIPSPKTLWHFDVVRMGPRWDDMDGRMTDQTVLEASSLGLQLGRRTLEDAMPVEALAGDDEAEYNDYYRMRGYKLDTVTDMETGVPLAKATMTINDDEAKVLVPQMEALEEAGIRPEEHWIDGGYDDYANLAWLGTHGVEAHHPIHENWVWNPKGEEAHLRKLYQAHWRDEDFRPEASMRYILAFLLDRGHEEEVGAYFRNRAMEAYQEDPMAYLAVYHRRNRQEGRHGYWKEQLLLEARLRRKGLVAVDRYLTRNLCAVLAAVLNRLQHGLRENLASIAYLT